MEEDIHNTHSPTQIQIQMHTHTYTYLYIKYITLKPYALYLSPKRGFEHVTEYRPEVVAEG